MKLSMLQGKIHRATVTQAYLDYDGSITVDKTLMDAAGLIEFQKVDVYDITNGNRLTTYVIEGEANSGVIGINGAAAHLVKPNDLVIIAAYVEMDEAEAKAWQPNIVLVDDGNKPRKMLAA